MRSSSSSYIDKSLKAFQYTFLFYPRRWYEHEILSSKALILLVTLPPFWLLAGLSVFPNLFLSILAIVIYFTGLALDVFSTKLVTDLKLGFDKRGLEFPVYEGAASFPPEPTLKDILTHWRFWFMVAAVPVIYIFPTGALGILIVRLSAAFSNFRSAKRLKLALLLIDDPQPARYSEPYVTKRTLAPFSTST